MQEHRYDGTDQFREAINDLENAAIAVGIGYGAARGSEGPPKAAMDGLDEYRNALLAAIAAEVEAKAIEPCQVIAVRSNVCARGTKCCIVDHRATPTQDSEGCDAGPV